MASRRRQTQRYLIPHQLLRPRHAKLPTYLKAVVYQPLERGESTNHHDTDWETIPEPPEADVAVDSRHGFAAALASCFLRQRHADSCFCRNSRQFNVLTLPISIQLADHDICRMADDRTSNTRDVASEERHTSLLQRIVALLRLSQRAIDAIDRSLKCSELDHRIRDLPSPERIQALIQPAIPLLPHHRPPPFP